MRGAEAKAKQVAQGKHMVRYAPAVGMVFLDFQNQLRDEAVRRALGLLRLRLPK